MKDVIGEDGLEGFEEECHVGRDENGYRRFTKEWTREDGLLKYVLMPCDWTVLDYQIEVTSQNVY